MKSPIPPQIKNPEYMKYRKKETCKICNKTLLLLTHIKTVHKIFSREEYDKRTAHLRVMEDKIGSTVKRTTCMSQTKDSEICPQQDSANESRRRKTLHEAMLQIEKRYGQIVKRKSLSATVKRSNKQKIQQEQPSEYCLEE